jgi:steroid delta-isomerase-like uncharacterized protein
MTREAIVNLFARREEAWKRRDAGALAGDHAENGVLESPMAGTVSGRKEIERVYRAWFTGFPDLKPRWDELLIDEGHVAQFGLVSGTDTGGFMGLPPTGKAFQLPVFSYYQLRDGTIVRLRTVYDFTGLLVQVGILKAKPV